MTRLADLRKKVPWDVQIFFSEASKVEIRVFFATTKDGNFGFVVCSMFFHIIDLKATKVTHFHDNRPKMIDQ